MGSAHQQIPWAGHLNVAASTGGIMALMQAMAQELAAHRLCVNSVAPGAIRTRIDRDLAHAGSLRPVDAAGVLRPGRRTQARQLPASFLASRVDQPGAQPGGTRRASAAAGHRKRRDGALAREGRVRATAKPDRANGRRGQRNGTSPTSEWRFGRIAPQQALDILNRHDARSEVTQAECAQVKSATLADAAPG